MARVSFGIVTEGRRGMARVAVGIRDMARVAVTSRVVAYLLVVGGEDDAEEGRGGVGHELVKILESQLSTRIAI